ncbi:hypothetical protein AB6E53_02360 [Vibrio breoganii]|uniref:Uncharacterized protein n=1 Tax=Vibrio breoganii TaxID=553239 RepID=A0AAP8MWR4_9VIBR|nr:hypothetical protein [Vibrio breoganii]PMP10231.1 hypothetical protein BCS93_11185 [Vibrio breoganii]
MTSLPRTFTLKTGRTYNCEQVLHCYLTSANDEEAVYFIVDPSRFMSYEITVELWCIFDISEIATAVKQMFLIDDYKSCPANTYEKLDRFGWISEGGEYKEKDNVSQRTR